MSFDVVRASAATALKTITFTDGKKLRADAYLSGVVNPPHAFFDFEVNAQLVFGSSSPNACVLHVQVLDQKDSERASQIRLDELRDPTNTHSLRQVLENGSNWDATVDYCRFLSASRVGHTNVGGVDFLSVDFEFEVVI